MTGGKRLWAARPKKAPVDAASLMRQHAGLRLAAVRHMLGLPAEAMANIMGVSKKAYQAYESGQNAIQPLPAYRLLVFEKVPMEWLFAGDLRRTDFEIGQRLTDEAGRLGAAIGGPVPDFPTPNRPHPPAAPRAHIPRTVHEEQREFPRSVDKTS